MTKIKHAYPDVQGYCPMGCGETLLLGEGGYVTCSWIECPDPEAVTKLLAVKPETDHIVLFAEDDGFTLQHPVRERIAGNLFDCELHEYLVSLAGPPVLPGRYRVVVVPPEGSNACGWTFEEIFEEIIETENENG